MSLHTQNLPNGGQSLPHNEPVSKPMLRGTIPIPNNPAPMSIITLREYSLGAGF